MAVLNGGIWWGGQTVSAAIAALVILTPALRDDSPGRFSGGAALPAGTDTAITPVASEPAIGIGPGAMETLPALVDRETRRLMIEQHAPGTAVAIVHDGSVVALGAYGTAVIETNTPVDAARTLFRVGSVAKPLTAAAVLRLADDGQLDLHRDVRDYLPGLSLRYAVNAHQLLTHTAGLDETFAGTFTRAPEDLEPLADYLRRTARSAVPPGLFYSYAGTNFAVAGWLLERLTGRPYAEAMRATLFAPLRLSSTTVRQPPEDPLLPQRARGYAWDGAQYRALPFRYIKHSPGGALSTTASDMSRFMLAVLGDGSLDGVRVLSDRSRAAFLHAQYHDHPALPGVTYGFHEWRTHGRVLLHHDGTLDDQVAVLLLDPVNVFGIFVASNSNPGIGNHLLGPVLNHLYGPEAPVDPVSPLHATGHAAAASGAYRDLHRTRHDLSSLRALMPMLQARVEANGDAIAFGGLRWEEIAPFVFQAAGSRDRIVFRGSPVTIMQTWNSTYERIGWRQSPQAQLGLAVACATVFFAWSVGCIRTWRQQRDGRAARACALIVALSNLAFIAWLGASLRGLGYTVPLPPLDAAFLILAIGAAPVAAMLPGFALSAWRHGWWTRGARASFTAVAVAAVVFSTWLNAWNLLGFRY